MGHTSVPTTPGFGTYAHGTTSGDATASGSGWPFGRQAGVAEDDEDEREVVGPDEDIDVDTEVDVVVDVPIPAWTAPTHTVHPVFINHKIKWSAFIK